LKDYPACQEKKEINKLRCGILAGKSHAMLGRSKNCSTKYFCTPFTAFPWCRIVWLSLQSQDVHMHTLAGVVIAQQTLIFREVALHL